MKLFYSFGAPWIEPDLERFAVLSLLLLQSRLLGRRQLELPDLQRADVRTLPARREKSLTLEKKLTRQWECQSESRLC